MPCIRPCLTRTDNVERKGGFIVNPFDESVFLEADEDLVQLNHLVHAFVHPLRDLVFPEPQRLQIVHHDAVFVRRLTTQRMLAQETLRRQRKKGSGQERA